MSCPTCQAATPAQANFCPNCGAALGATGDPRRALREATRLIAADAGRDLDATLDTLTRQARGLLGADAATLRLAAGDGDELEVWRPGQLARSDRSAVGEGARILPDAFTREAMA